MAPPRDRALDRFAGNVLRQREARGFSQDKLAEKADLDRTYISGIERGLRNPSLRIICQLAKALGVSVSELCEGVRA
jgi:transcriptional regulator with XRE-family HTH domain